jgi:hypothetical protein
MQEKILTILFITSLVTSYTQSFITTPNETGAFPVVTSFETTSIYVDENDDWLVHKAASLLQNDIEMVTGKKTCAYDFVFSNKKHHIQLPPSSVAEKNFNSKKQLII